MWRRNQTAMIRKAIIIVLTSMAFLLLLPDGCELVATGGIDGWDSSNYMGMCEQIRTDKVWLMPCWKIQRLLVQGALATANPSPPVDWAVKVPLVGTFSYFTFPGPPGWRNYVLRVPGWLVLVAILAYPMTALARGPVRRWRRRRKGRCLRCGYDLTGNVSGACPECGTEIKTT